MEHFAGHTFLGRYEVELLLGEGGMGAVYKARDTKLHRDVALKIMHSHLAREREFQERFLQEARTAARLRHPGIVQVFDFGEGRSILYIVMEFISGDSLRAMIEDLRARGEKMLMPDAIKLVHRICLAVDYAHRQGVLHRDIKPDNIILKPMPGDDFPYEPILTDLGLAKLLEGDRVTQPGFQMGTPSYMSPEQAMGEEMDIRSDVYALGVLLYELMVGRPPFAFRTITEAIRYYTQVRARPLNLPFDRQLIPTSTQRVIIKALARNPAERFPDARAFAQALVAELPGTVTAYSAPTVVMARASPKQGTKQKREIPERNRVTPQEEEPEEVDSATLRSILITYFNEKELRDLCFDLGVDYDNLEGHGKGSKARELVAYFERRGKTSQLVNACRRQRPNAFTEATRKPRSAISRQLQNLSRITRHTGTKVAKQLNSNTTLRRLLAYAALIGASAILTIALVLSILPGWPEPGPPAGSVAEVTREADVPITPELVPAALTGTEVIATTFATTSEATATWMVEDSDGDKLSNSKEVEAHTNPEIPDTDGDGLNDGDELDLGSATPTSPGLDPSPAATPGATLPPIAANPTLTVTPLSAGGEEPIKFVVLWETMNVRQGPDTRAATIATAVKEQELTVLPLPPVRDPVEDVLWWPVHGEELQLSLTPVWIAEIDWDTGGRLVKPSLYPGMKVYISNWFCGGGQVGRGQVNLHVGENLQILDWNTELQVLGEPSPVLTNDSDDVTASLRGRQWWPVEVAVNGEQGWIADFASHSQQLLIAPEWYMRSSPLIMEANAEQPCG